MMGAVQPFISGAISKTVNMPEEATVEDVEDLHLQAWKLGLKAVAIYRDNCKVAQPLSSKKDDDDSADAGSASVSAAENEAAIAQAVDAAIAQVRSEPIRKKLPKVRNSKTFSFRVADCHGYVTVGEYEDGRPGEIFLKVAKQGSTLAGIMDAFAISVSHGLQYGVPLRVYVEQYTNMRFEPAGITDDPDLRIASSLIDYIFRRLALEYLPYEERVEIGVLSTGERMQPTLPGIEEATTASTSAPEVSESPSAPPVNPGYSASARTLGEICQACGSANMQRAGSCMVCADCGSTSGCS
jgi:ribonucleoside-diphosphate reductase alpha chain